MTGTLTHIDIVGRGGRTLREKWAEDGLKSNLGINAHGFPNFFMSLGPQTPYSNLIVPIQLGAQWLQRALKWAEEHGIEYFEATPESEDWWRAETEKTGRQTVMYTEGKKAKAWFLGENIPGKPEEFQVYMGGGQVYQRYCRELEESGYATLLHRTDAKQPVDA